MDGGCSQICRATSLPHPAALSHPNPVAVLTLSCPAAHVSAFLSPSCCLASSARSDVVIQSLWHIASFRERFSRLPHHRHQRDGLIHDYVGVRAASDSANGPQRLQHQSSDDDLALISDAESAEARLAAAGGGALGLSPSSGASTSESLDERDTCVCCALKLIFVHYGLSAHTRRHTDSGTELLPLRPPVL